MICAADTRTDLDAVPSCQETQEPNDTEKAILTSATWPLGLPDGFYYCMYAFLVLDTV